MNILFLTLIEIKDFSQTGIYPDLINEFARHEHDVYVISPCEKKNKSRFTLIKEKGRIHLVSALIPDYFGTRLIKKGISSLLIGKRYMKAIKKAIPYVKFDLVLYSTPPITFSSVIEKVKHRDNAYTYLLLKDIWPQGLIDIGVLSTTGLKGIVTRYFRKKEKRLYNISDSIGCMSKKNVEYLIEKFGIKKKKVEICPNSIKVRKCINVNKEEIRRKNDLPENKTIFVYGGNLGIAQGIDFVISCLAANEKMSETFILIIGSGTEYQRLEKWFNSNHPNNSKLIPSLDKEKYMEIMAACDVGLIFLDHRFTIPNFPSRLLSYMEAGMPVIAATDPNTDIGQVIEEGGFGYWCESNDIDGFISCLDRFIDKRQRMVKGKEAYNYLLENYSIEKVYEIIKGFWHDGG